MATNYSNYMAYNDASDNMFDIAIQLKTAKSFMNGVYNKYGEDSLTYKNAKASFDATYKEYNDAIANLKRIKKEIDDDIAKKQKVKDDKKAKEDKKLELDSLKYERDKATRENREADAQAAQDKINTILAATPKPDGSTDGTPATGDITIEQDKFSGYTLDKGQVNGTDGPVIFVDKINSNGTATPIGYPTRSKAFEAFIAGYKKPGDIQKLQQQLLASNYIKQSQIADGTWVEGAKDMLAARSYKMVSEVKYGSGKPISVTDFLGQKKSDSGNGTDKPIVSRNLSTRGDAKQQLDSYLTDLRGEPSTDAEYEAYYKQLHAEEMKQTSTYKDGTTLGGVMTDAERFVIAAKVARNSLRGADASTLLNASKGSQLAMDISALQEAAADYGIDMTAAEALKQITNGIGQANYLDKQKERLKLIAKQLHPNLVNHIDAGGTVLEVANVYAQRKASKLGIVVTAATKDKDVMEAVATGKPIAQFEKEMQANPLWRFTDEARDTASDFLSTIGRMWGRG